MGHKRMEVNVHLVASASQPSLVGFGCLTRCVYARAEMVRKLSKLKHPTQPSNSDDYFGWLMVLTVLGLVVLGEENVLGRFE